MDNSLREKFSRVWNVDLVIFWFIEIVFAILIAKFIFSPPHHKYECGTTIIETQKYDLFRSFIWILFFVMLSISNYIAYILPDIKYFSKFSGITLFCIRLYVAVVIFCALCGVCYIVEVLYKNF